MTSIEYPPIARHARTHRTIDFYAAGEAAAALRAAAARTGDPLLASANALLQDANDPAAADRLRAAVISPGILSLLPQWIRELREVASVSPDSGACTVATALKLWLWTARHFRSVETPSVFDELTETLASLIAARCLSLDVAIHTDELRRDLAQVYAARVSATAGATCAELVFGYRRHLVWDEEGCAACYSTEELDGLEAFMPGFASGGRTTLDVIETDGSHPAKRGPCANFNGLDMFVGLRNQLDACLTGARIAKDRAAAIIGRA